jgi:hypothetical protein
LDVRRAWECPVCGRRVRRQGDITTYQCHCQDPPVWMRLVESQRESRVYQPYIVPEIQADELIGEEEPTPIEPPLVEEVAMLVETIEPGDIDAELLEDEFYSPEDELDDPPAGVDIADSEPLEFSISKPEVETGPSPDQQPETSSHEQARPGKPRRRRSGRKRSRRPDSPEGDSQGG